MGEGVVCVPFRSGRFLIETFYFLGAQASKSFFSRFFVQFVLGCFFGLQFAFFPGCGNKRL